MVDSISSGFNVNPGCVWGQPKLSEPLLERQLTSQSLFLTFSLQTASEIFFNKFITQKDDPNYDEGKLRMKQLHTFLRKTCEECRQTLSRGDLKVLLLEQKLVNGQILVSGKSRN